MDDFDSLAKESARTLSRRQVIGRVVVGAGAAALALFGLRRFAASDNCMKVCAECCQKNAALRGTDLAECIRQCHDGEGLCGPVFQICQQQQS